MKWKDARQLLGDKPKSFSQTRRRQSEYSIIIILSIMYIYYYITCTKIVVIWLVESRSLL